MKLNVQAFAFTAGILWGAALLLVGIANLIWPSYGVALLHLVASIYPGYDATASIDSVIFGGLFGFLDGAIAGLVFAWLYNVFVSK